ncbi:MAG TPA: hypothetical protein VM638_03100 [Actinomycetota bacterium]|nr:hypothetical protein [Actinomycetota bacterium]
MRAEFFRPESPEETYGVASWDGVRAVVEASSPEAEQVLGRVFSPAPVAIDDASLRQPGAHGESVIEPGRLEWFRAAAMVRGAREGLGVRFASDAPGGWDPAGTYRPMRQWVARKELPR